MKNQNALTTMTAATVISGKSTFEPRAVRKRQKDIYRFETSDGFISDVADKMLPQIEDWQNRPLSEVYPILYIDAIRKLAAYVILGINAEGRKEALTISKMV